MESDDVRFCLSVRQKKKRKTFSLTQDILYFMLYLLDFISRYAKNASSASKAATAYPITCNEKQHENALKVQFPMIFPPTQAAVMLG